VLSLCDINGTAVSAPSTWEYQLHCDEFSKPGAKFVRVEETITLGNFQFLERCPRKSTCRDLRPDALSIGLFELVGSYVSGLGISVSAVFSTASVEKILLVRGGCHHVLRVRRPT
jgi:hypothetical protein